MFDHLPTGKNASTRSLFNQPLSGCEVGTALAMAFEQKATKFSCLDNQILFHRGDPCKCVYLVRSGEVDLILLLSSTRAIGFRAKAGSLIGLPAAFSGEPYSMTAVAYRGAELGVMGRRKFCATVSLDPDLSLHVLRILAAETRAARIAITDAGMKQRRRVPAAP